MKLGGGELSDILELEKLGLTLEQVRGIVKELGYDFDELLSRYKDVTETQELTEVGFVLELIETGKGQSEQGDDVATWIEVGLHILNII